MKKNYFDMITNHLHYKLGTSLKAIKNDLVFNTTLKWGEEYKNKNVQPIVLYGKEVGVIYNLIFSNDVLTRIECLFNIKHFEFIFKGIKNELPKEVVFDKDPFISSEGYFCFLEDIIITLDKFKNHFKLLVVNKS